jgi:hypothetical protein
MTQLTYIRPNHYHLPGHIKEARQLKRYLEASSARTVIATSTTKSLETCRGILNLLMKEVDLFAAIVKMKV